MLHPHLLFLLALVVVGPLAAIAGMATGGPWAPFGIAIGAVLVAASAARSAGVLRGRPRGFLQMRMLGLTVTVALAATLLAIGALVVLAVDLFG